MSCSASSKCAMREQDMIATVTVFRVLYVAPATANKSDSQRRILTKHHRRQHEKIRHVKESAVKKLELCGARG